MVIYFKPKDFIPNQEIEKNESISFAFCLKTL